MARKCKIVYLLDLYCKKKKKHRADNLTYDLLFCVQRKSLCVYERETVMHCRKEGQGRPQPVRMRTLRTLLLEMLIELREYRLHTHIRILQRSNLDRRNWARYLRQQKTKDWSFTNFKIFLACFKNFGTRKNIRSSRQPSQKATSCISRLHKRLSPFHKLSGFKYDISLVVERIHDLSDVAK